MWPFRRTHTSSVPSSRGDSIDLDELSHLVADNPVKRYVNLVLLHLADSGLSEWSADEASGLPRVPSEPDFDMTSVTFSQVINRLKVMSNLDPVHFRTPRDGRIELTISHRPGEDTRPYDADVHFVDHPVRTVKLRLRRAE